MTEALQKPSLETSGIPDMDERLHRAFEIELALDPEHTLPNVTLAPDPSKLVPRGGTLTIERNLITHEDITVGNYTLMWDKKTNERWFHGINIDETFRGQGFGLATYKEVIEQSVVDGCDFRTEDWSQTEGAKRIWEKLREKGLAEAVSEFTPDGNGQFTGEYIVRAGAV